MKIPAALLLSLGLAAAAAPPAPPGYNIHLVAEAGGRRFWRGGAPTPATLRALAEQAEARGVALTLIDLRSPANADDRSGKGGRLSPAAEAALARRLGARYLPVSALDRGLVPRLDAARREGDVYLHCMYGVNRTGFAVARYARARGLKPGRKGLGRRDWEQGWRFEQPPAASSGR